MAAYQQKFMDRAIELSEIAITSGKGLPIGCVIVKDDIVVGEGHNEVLLRNNPTAHAEMVAIEYSCRNSGLVLLSGCELYTSMQPCPMCFGAIYWAGIKTVYYGASAEQAAESGFDDRFIFHELKKAPSEQLIPMQFVPQDSAVSVLRTWQKLNPTSVAGRYEHHRP